MHEISDTESTASNVRSPEREIHTLEILEPTMKGQIYMQASNVKKTNKQAKKEPTIKFWDDTNKKITHK